MQMFSRLALVIAVAGLIAALAPPSPARAADEIVARDTLIQYVWPLDDDFVYRRLGRTRPKRVWMGGFPGELRRARGIPQGASSGGIGLDANGRKVFTFSVQRYKQGYLLSSKWFVYDLARDRTRAVRGLAAKCPVYWLAMWRESTVYTTRCKNPDENGVFLRQGKRTRRLPADPWASYVFR